MPLFAALHPALDRHAYDVMPRLGRPALLLIVAFCVVIMVWFLKRRR